MTTNHKKGHTHSQHSNTLSRSGQIMTQETCQMAITSNPFNENLEHFKNVMVHYIDRFVYLLTGHD